MEKAIFIRFIALTFTTVFICSFITAAIFSIYTHNHTYSGWLYHLLLQLPAMLVAISVVLFLSLIGAKYLTKTITKPIEKELEISEQQLEQKKQDFFSNAAHELKTPITSILGFSEMLSNGLVENNDEIIKRIESEAKNLSALIDDMLTVSRLEPNQINENRADVNFGDIVKEAVAPFESLADSSVDSLVDSSVRNANVTIKLDVDDVIICADKRQLYELCTKLIENAVKYNKPDGTVYISLKSNADSVILCVRDTGIGISPENQSRVFERFFRVDYGRDKRVGGTGLGLAIVKHIVDLYGGNISLKSKLGEGTEITVTLRPHRLLHLQRSD